VIAARNTTDILDLKTLVVNTASGRQVRIAGLEDRLPLYESCEDALRALQRD
jgi:hypothetical protein